MRGVIRALRVILRRGGLFLLTFGPTLLLALWAVRTFRGQIDAELARLGPVAEVEAQRYLGRDVHIGCVGPDLTVARLLDLWRHPETVGAFPVVFNDVVLGARPDERASVGGPILASARRVTLHVSASGLRGAHPAQEALPLVRVEGLDANVVRAADQSFPLERFIPDDGRPKDSSLPPFRTRIEVADSRLRFRDFGVRPRAPMEETALVGIDAALDLTGARIARFSLSARAQPGTPTAARLGGALSAQGAFSRGEPGVRVDAPAPETPLFFALIRAADVALPYWQKYWAPVPGLDLQAGRGDIRVSLVAPRAPKSGPPVTALAQVAFRGVRLRHDAAPAATLEDAAGELTFDDSVLRVSTRARVWGAPVQAEAQLWDLNRTDTLPRLAARVDAPALPVRALVQAAKAPALPRDLALGETLAVRGLRLSGPLDRLRADGIAQLDRLGWTGAPTLRTLEAHFAWAEGTLAADRVTARIDGGGSFAGRLELRPTAGLAQASLKAEGIDLRRIAALRAVKDPRLTISGFGSVEASGSARRQGARWVPAATASVHADSLKVGRLSLPAATAQLRVDGDRIQVAAARVGGPVGIAGLRGVFDPERGLSLQGSLVGIDLGRIGEAFAVPGLDGVGSVTVAIEGPLASPVATLRDLSVLGPRVRVEDRLLNADALRCEEVRIALRKDRTIDASLIRPARLSLYPAELVVSGQVRGPIAEPQLELTGQVENLDFGRIVQLAGGQPARYAPPLLRDNPAFVSLTRDLGWADEPPPVAGRVIQASARVTGTLKRPRVAGRMALRQMRIGRYPIDSGDAEFAYQDGGVTLSNAHLKASAGEARWEARLAPGGDVSGRFEVAALKLEALSPLAEPVATLAGTLKVSGTLSGDINHPVIAAETGATGDVRIAGVVLGGLRVGRLRAEMDRTKETLAADLAVEELHGALGGAQIAVRRLTFALPDRRASADATVTGATVAGVLRALREAPREETTVGEALQKAADTVPDAFDGQIDVTLNGQTEFSDDGKPIGPHATATLASKDLTLGPTRFTSFGAEARLDDRRVTISKLSLENASALVDGGGTVDLPEKSGDPLGLDLRLESVQPSLDLVRAFLPDFALHGTLDSVSVVARGTTEDPKIQATLEGSGLAYRPPGRPELTLDHVRLNSQLRRDTDGDLLLTLDDGLIQRGAQEVRLDVALPVDPNQGRILAARPIRKLELRLKDLELPTLASAADLPVTRVAGALNGRIAVEGSLNQPRLAGEVRLKGASAAFVRVGGSKRDPLNAIAALDVQADLAGSTISLKGTRLALGPTPGDKPKPGGEVNLTGDIQLENLEDFTQLFMRRTADRATPQLKGRFNLSANLVNLRPDVDNLSAALGGKGGLGEQGTGVLNGTVTITGPLLTPSIATAPDRPLRLVDAALRMPKANTGTKSPALVFNPQLAVRIEVVSDARVVLLDSLAAQLGFQGRGNVGLGGTLSDPRIDGTFTPTGGVLRYPLARLDIRRGGVAQLNYSSQNNAQIANVVLSGVTAEGRITGVVGGSNRRNTETGIINTGLSASSARNESVTYRILAEINGTIDLNKLTSGDFLQQLTLSSSPPLSKQEIIELLGAQRQLDMIFSGGSQQAIRDIGRRIGDVGLFDGLFDPLTRRARDFLQLDEFNISYNLDGTALFRIGRRLPEPFDRFSVDLSRTFATRTSSSQILDFRYGINYELFQLGKAGRYQPRLLLGAELSSERRFPFYFVRGTVNY